MVMPLAEMSPVSSGGVRSSTQCTASTIAEETSSSASRISLELTVNVRGRPVIRQRPLTSMIASSLRGYTQPTVRLISSAVRSPISALCLRRTYLTMASSNLSPATLMDVDSTMPPSEITATSVVPPPISTTRLPLALLMLMPAPMAAATGSSTRKTRFAPACVPASMTARSSTSVMMDGTQMTTFGLNRWIPCTFAMNSLIMRSVIS